MKKNTSIVRISTALLFCVTVAQAAVTTIKLDFGKDNQAPNIDFSDGGNCTAGILPAPLYRRRGLWAEQEQKCFPPKRALRF